MTEDIENGTTIVESDIEPILKSSSKEGQIRELSPSKKCAVIGEILALTSSLFLHCILWISYQEILHGLCGHIISRQVPEP